MKRTIILGIAAFVFAIGSAFVSKGTMNGKTDVIYRQSTASPSKCVVSTCNLTSLQPCSFQSYSTQVDENTCADEVASFKN